MRRNNGLEIDNRDRDISELRARLQELMNDYDELMNNKTTLEFEINTYRRLLECEETRGTRVPLPTQPPAADFSKFKYTTITTSTSSAASVGPSIAVNIAQSTQPIVVQQQQQQQAPAQQLPPGDFRLSASEMSSKTTFQRSAKGPVSISECSPDGKVIILENTSRNKDITMTGWVLKRRVDSKEELTYKFPPNLVLKSNKTVRIWARGANGAKENPPTDLVNANVDNWGMGVNVVTIVLNDVGDEKATHLQKTVYAS